jgi:hypothetical protein
MLGRTHVGRTNESSSRAVAHGSACRLRGGCDGATSAIARDALAACFQLPHQVQDTRLGVPDQIKQRPSSGSSRRSRSRMRQRRQRRVT